MQINWDVIYNYLFFAVTLILWGEFRALISRRIYNKHQWKNHLDEEIKYNLEERDLTIKHQKHKIEIYQDRLKHQRRSITAMLKIGLSDLKDEK